MAQISVSEASKLVSRDRKTLYRLIKQGKLSATVSDSGMTQVETSELMRVFGEISQSGDKGDSGATVSMPQNETPSESFRVELLKLELRHARDILEEKERLLVAKESQIEDLRNSVRLLEGPKAEPKKRWFW